MKSFVINGQRRLCGETDIQGSKNSVLPIMAATVLVNGESIIHNCPELSDVDAAVKILRLLGCTVKREGHTLIVNSENVSSYEIPDRLMREMRSSVMFLGAILGRMGKAVLSTPGGCEIGLRPIDIHISSLRLLGVKFADENGKLKFDIPDGLQGTRVTLPFPSVGATENVMLAACTAEGITVINNAAREPEISDLADFLNKCGAHISGAGESTVIIQGVKSLNSAEHRVISDRIVAASYLLCAAVTNGNICITDVVPSHIGSVLPVLREMGCTVETGINTVKLLSPEKLRRIRLIRTMPYPGFPTDIQAPVTAALSVADGTSVVIENIFESRYKHVGELLRFGAKIHIEGRMAVIEGVNTLNGATVNATDLRGGFAMLIAALAAKGGSVVLNTEHIDRGYEAPELVLSKLGADIKRTE